MKILMWQFGFTRTRLKNRIEITADFSVIKYLTKWQNVTIFLFSFTPIK